jgi:anti-anti-sigma factor
MGHLSPSSRHEGSTISSGNDDKERAAGPPPEVADGLRFAAHRSEKGTLVIVAGEIDASNTSTFASLLDDVVATAPAVLALDLSELMFIASSGLNVLINTDQRLREQKGAIVIRSASPPVMKVLDVTGLAARFSLGVTTLNDAKRRWEEAAAGLDHWMRLQSQRTLTDDELEQRELSVLAEREWWLTYQAHRLRAGGPER